MLKDYSAEKLRKSILVYSVVGISVVALLAALIVVIPLNNRLHKEYSTQLVHKVKIKSMIVEEFLFRAKDTALQITSRTQVRKKLESYNKKETTFAELNEFTVPRLADAMSVSDDVVGISRIDNQGKQIAQVGIAIPENLWKIPGQTDTQVKINGPVKIGQRSYLVICAPILSDEFGCVGTDIVLYRTDTLKKIIHESSTEEKTCETIIGKLENSRAQSFYPSIPSMNGSIDNFIESHTFSVVLEKTSKNETGVMDFESSDGDKSLVAFGPIHNGMWGVVVKMPENEAFATIKKLVFQVGCAVIVFIAFGTWGMSTILKPLVGKILIQADDFQAKIDEQILELKDAYQLLQESQIELSQKHKMEALGVMAGGIAHNFNNSLSVILGSLELVSLKLKDRGESDENIENSKSEIMRSRDLVNKLMTYSRKDPINKSLHQLAPILEEAVSLLRTTVPQSIKISLKIESNCDGSVLINDIQLMDVLITLCNNSVDAMKAGGLLLLSLERVELDHQTIPSCDISRPGSYMLITVKDSGCGIPSKDLEKIFDPFYTTKEMYKGAGMGLSTVKGSIRQYNGIVKVESTLGQGSLFYIYLPIEKNSKS